MLKCDGKFAYYIELGFFILFCCMPNWNYNDVEFGSKNIYVIAHLLYNFYVFVMFPKFIYKCWIKELSSGLIDHEGISKKY